LSAYTVGSRGSRRRAAGLQGPFQSVALRWANNEGITSKLTIKTRRTGKNCPQSRIELRPTALPRPRALDDAAVASLGRAAPHASPR